MRSFVCLGALVGALAFVPSAAALSADLRIVVWPHGTARGAAKTWALRCNPAGGTLPHAAGACRRLASLRDPFAPVPPGVACSLIYGGPQVALVTGSFRGRRIWARFKRTDSCQTDRWNKVAFLFPVQLTSA